MQRTRNLNRTGLLTLLALAGFPLSVLAQDNTSDYKRFSQRRFALWAGMAPNVESSNANSAPVSQALRSAYDPTLSTYPVPLQATYGGVYSAPLHTYPSAAPVIRVSPVGGQLRTDPDPGEGYSVQVYQAPVTYGGIQHTPAFGLGDYFGSAEAAKQFALSVSPELRLLDNKIRQNEQELGRAFSINSDRQKIAQMQTELQNNQRDFNQRLEVIRAAFTEAVRGEIARSLPAAAIPGKVIPYAQPIVGTNYWFDSR